MAAAAPDTFLLVVSLAGTPERTAHTCSGVSLIGRGDECSVRLPHLLVSRRHVEIAPAAEGSFTVRDLGSRNGTLVNGTLLRDAERIVAGGTAIQIGPYLLTPIASGGSEETVIVGVVGDSQRVALSDELRQVLIDGQVAVSRLSDLEYRFLQALTQHPHRVMTNKALGDATWDAGQWDTYMLHNLVRRLRRKFVEHGRQGDEFIVTVPGVGYRLV